jgi:ATP/maltotriose-dependent transcriptional regulator MalT
MASDQRVLLSFTLVNELLLALLPYQPEQLAERQRLAEEECAAQARGAGAFSGDRPLGIGVQWLHLLEGRWAEAEELGTLERSAFEQGALRQYAVCTLGEIARHRGDREQAWRWVREILPLGDATEPGDHRYFSAVYIQRLAAALALDDGDPGLARDWLVCHDRWLDWSGAVLWRAEGQLLWARYFRQSGDVSRAHTFAREAWTLASTPRQPLALLAAERFLGELATVAGDFAGAQTHLDQARALAETCALPYERLLTLLSLAELRVTTNDVPLALALLAEARPIAVGLAALPALKRLDALEQQLSGPPRARGPSGLSAREVDVLLLAAEGFTDGQIAERLSISRRTVGQHLSSIYTRLNVPSRAAAVREAVARGLI